MNWFWIAARAQGPAVVLLILAMLVAEVFDRTGALAGGVDNTARAISFYLPIAAAVGGTLWGIAVWLRLTSWERGSVECCDHCSGPLGFIERPGKRMYGRQLPNFFRCWNCGKATAADNSGSRLDFRGG